MAFVCMAKEERIPVAYNAVSLVLKLHQENHKNLALRFSPQVGTPRKAYDQKYRLLSSLEFELAKKGVDPIIP